MTYFKKVAIANRGEISVRIIKTLKEMNITSVLLHSLEDQGSLAYRLADETLCIGGGHVQESYSNISAVVNGALSMRANALHPGVGFLSENYQLAQACKDQNIVFIGPAIEHIQLFGNKLKALKHVHSLGVPLLSSYFGSSQDDETLLNESVRIGFPLLIKLALGGGGVGIKKVNRKEDFLEALTSVQNLGKSIFNSSDVYIEKFLEEGQHIEVQIFGDSHGNIRHLFGRNCSVQKRNQKVIEESLFGLHPNIEQKLYQIAVDIGKSIQYKNAGTVEFLLKDDEFYFLELNTRLQVEHPVTELLLGVDLVKAQILEAIGEKPFEEELVAKGHTLECRICSQDFQTGYPVSGEFGTIQWMQAPHSRLDMGYESYDRLSSLYDSLIGKIIVWAENRTQCIEKMKSILENSIVFGLPTNQAELLSVLNHSDFIENKFHIGFLEEKIKTPSLELSQEEQQLIQGQCALLKSSLNSTSSAFNPWLHQWPE